MQISVDAAGPRSLGAFWCEVLGYVEQPPPPGFDNWVDPDGVGPRLFFQRVPEAKTAKNRFHLDVNVCLQ